MHKLKMLPVLMLMVIFSPLAIDIFLPALPLMADNFSVSLPTMQWSISIFMLSMGLGQLFTGPLTDKYGRKPVALIGIVIYALSSLLTVYAATIELHLISRLLQGFGTCAVAVAAFSVVRDKFDAIQSGIMYSYLNGLICCIPALAPILGSWLTQTFNWQSNFVFLILYAVVAGLLIAYYLIETNQTPVNQRRLINPFKMSRYKSIICHKVFLFHAFVVMIAMGVILAYVSSSPAWLMVELKLSQNEFVFWFSLNAVINIIACVTAPKILIRKGAARTISLGLLTLFGGGLLMLVLQPLHTPVAFMLPVMLSSIGFSLVMGTCAGQALASFGDKAGTASALLGFMQMSGAAILVGLVQMLPITISEQIALLMLLFAPMMIIWFSAKGRRAVLV
ncbi:multidrug effflux MFS transporter [Thalassotalea psychrophila]|uniref:Bcr/CflA family efflux transporter n=1 Tax=Thalassotalea psychrophila TaxID=3065647 RepID=A0ABY9TS56_9GAMM|nr:multidrug effflux MFS transporter [Colwelliaceae bacterium SQ149]